MVPRLHNRKAFLDKTLDVTAHKLWVYRHKFQAPPAGIANGASTAAQAGYDPLFEVAYKTNVNTIAVAQNGISITHVADTQYGCFNVAPAIYTTPTILNSGHSTTRATATVQPCLKTGAATDADQGRGIKLVWPVVFGASLAKGEFLCGLIMGYASQAAKTDQLGLVPAASTKFSASTVYDGCGFYLDNSAGTVAGSAVGKLYGFVVGGASPAMTSIDLKTQLLASTAYTFECEIQPDRTVVFRINGVKVGQSAAKVDASTSLVPVLGLKTYGTTGGELNLVVGEPTLYKKII